MKSSSLCLHGDSGSVYTVTLADPDGGAASLACSCPAGKKGGLCKHVRDLLAGDFRRAAAESADVEAFRALLAASGLAERTAPLVGRLMTAETQLETLKREISGLKKDIWRLIA